MRLEDDFLQKLDPLLGACSTVSPEDIGPLIGRDSEVCGVPGLVLGLRYIGRDRIAQVDPGARKVQVGWVAVVG